MQELQILELLENGETITHAIQVEHLDIWLHKFFAVKIILMKLTILQLGLLLMK